MAGRLAQLIAESSETQAKTIVDNAREIRLARLFNVRKNIMQDLRTLKKLKLEIDAELNRLGFNPALNKSKLKN
ncbi:MAG: hypothetical protein KGL95_11245 [Patescibacteria group bacterium]|nr:hypothetical protein [Patescibacteria group bacterium]